MGTSSGKQNEKAYIAEDSRFFFKKMVTHSQILSIESEYTLLKMIGKGTYAEVYKSQSVSSKVMRAIKKVNKSKAPGIERLLGNEFELLKDIDHPNIIKIYGLQQDSKYFYMISELVGGTELFNYFSSKPTFTEKEAFVIFYQVLLALNHLQLNHIMHRDIKLENIIYDEKTQTLKLIDFGNAYAYQSESPIILNCVGTPAYIAPEVIQRRYNYKCDNWSLGVLLYLLISKTMPFGGKNNQEMFSNITSQPLEFSKEVWKTASASVKSLIEGLLQKNADKRLKLSAVFEHPWVKTSWASRVMTAEDNQFLLQILGNMRAFKNIKIAEIQLGVLVFMTNFIITIENEDAYIRCFNQINSNGDGVIKEQELANAMIEFQDRPLKKAKTEAAQIMSKLDFNGSQDISYSEFLVAAIDLNRVLTDQNLERTFGIIDTDKSGALSAGELKLKLGSEMNESYYKKLIAYFDTDKDGQISLSEFKVMMRGLIFKA